MRSYISWLAMVVLVALGSGASAQSTEPAIFITNNVGDSVTSMTINPDGSLSYVGKFTSGEGPQTISLTPDGRFLAVGHGTISSTTEQLRIFQVNGDATLAHVLTSLVPDSPLDAQWLSDEYLAVTETSLSNDNHVRTYRYDEVANTLTPEDVDFTGDFNTALDLTDGGQFLFANNSLGGNSIFSFSVDGGTLMQVDNELMGSNFAVGIKASHDGSFVYGAGGISGDDRRIFAFSVDATGALDPLPAGSFTSPGVSPKVIGITGDDSVLVAGHGTDATVRTFLRDAATGALTATAFSFDVGIQGSLGDLQVMDDLLFVSDESEASVYSFRVNANGSLTQLGSAVATQGSRPEYIATWSGLVELVCDFDGNLVCDVDDLNLLLDEGPLDVGVPVTPGVNDQFDLNGDQTLDLTDRDAWLALAGAENGFASPYKVGDATLDGVVDGLDFIAWNEHRFSSSLQWDFGDFNGDGFVDGADFIEWNLNKFTASDVAAVPEPGVVVWLLLAALKRRRVNSGPTRAQRS